MQLTKGSKLIVTGIIAGMLVAPLPLSAQNVAAIVGNVFKEIFDSKVLEKVVDSVIEHYQTKKDIHCRLHDFYQAMLNVQHARNNLKVAIQSRVNELNNNPHAPSNSPIASNLQAKAKAEDKALATLREAFKKVDVDLDQHAEKVSQELPTFTDKKQGLVGAAENQANLSNIDTLKKLLTDFDQDTKYYDDCLKQLNDLVMAKYPNLGDISAGC